ncbi:hypothetical protein [Myxococcus stipitatus]|uniref:hypothetical protein n=1 Tax=Myxococcus stipitatus TaxID=83455 RepID=UPI0030D240D5
MRDADERARRLKWGLSGLGVALVLMVLVGVWERRPLPGGPVVESREETSSPELKAEGARVVPRAAEAEAPRSKVVPEEAPPSATVVPLGPGDVAPEPEVENPPPQRNDEIQPEQPQTAQWRLEKTTHITALLGRDVERLERERDAAAARGDDERVRQVNTLLQRNRGQLDHLRDEIRALTAEVEQEALNAR